MHDHPIAAGKSSFDLVDQKKVFAELDLKKDTAMLDVACGVGRYSIAASEIIGREGVIYAVDLWEDGINSLKQSIAEKGIKNIKPVLSDVSKHIPVADKSIDIVLMATVLHDLIEVNVHDGTLREAARVLKPGGRLVIIEFKKIEGPPGPPAAIRLSPEELEKVVSPYGFKQEKVVDAGPHNYLSVFS
ncbi:MAG: methyltransferase domain-containing protein [Nitrospirae bacterium]|nr:methyltransferase domain-containing protein [Nitrospirota bacterium]